ncbi:hypothetical protein [Burkholderia pseudomallei]|uniref:hypothetical protein n=1 Tax=Burkholderia pseudomallei TaxID=28450 RepID=UPI00399D6636
MGVRGRTGRGRRGPGERRSAAAAPSAWPRRSRTRRTRARARRRQRGWSDAFEARVGCEGENRPRAARAPLRLPCCP